MIIKILSSILFLGVFILRLLRPELNIDSISVILMLLTLSPWFIKYIKTLELNGIGRVELVTKPEKQSIQKRYDEIVISDRAENNTIKEAYIFNTLKYEDPKLALAALRIELEKTLKIIAKRKDLDVDKKGLNKVTDILLENNLLSNNERALINDIAGVLNKAVHSQLEDYNLETYNWVFDIGMSLLEELGKKSDE